MEQKKSRLENFLKMFIIIFMIMQPFLDTYYLYTDELINIFKFSISTIIRFGVIGIFMIYEFIKSFKEKRCFPIIATIMVTIIYIVLHHLCAVNFNSVNPNNFNYSFIQDVFYVARLILPVFIIIIVIDFKITFKEMLKIIQISSFIIGFIIVISNFLKIGLCSYNNLVVKDNIIGWFTGAYEKYSYYTLASKGWFNFANQIAALIVIFLPFNIYSMFKKTSFLNIINVVLLMLSALIIGTRVALYGAFGMFFVMLCIYLFDAIVNKKRIKVNISALIVSIIILALYGFIYPYSPAKDRQDRTNAIIETEQTNEKITSNKKTTTSKSSTKITMSELNKKLEELKNSDDTDAKIDFIGKYYKYYKLDSGFIEDSYSYKQDPDFWIGIMELPIENRIDYRYLEQAIIERVSNINNHKIASALFGISYSRVQNIFNIEKDFVLQYYTLGIVGLILFFIIPFVLFPICFALKMLKNKNINIENIMLVLAMFLFVGIGYFSGNLIDALTATIYIGLILGVMCLQYKGEKAEEKVNDKKKITIVALHLGYGGVESVISSLANMLCKNFEVEIISTYKLLDKPAFELNSNVKIKYLIKALKPNKKEIKEALKNKKVFQALKECLKSIKILFLKKYRLLKEIKKIDTDIIITTRDIHNKWIGKYAPDNTIKIAQEHNHHNNNEKYIKKVLRSLKNTDYLIPASQELTEFYKEKLKNKKIKVEYIPSALNFFPEKTSELASKNIVSVGRLSQEKGYSDLIKVYKEIHNKDNSIKLKIIGDGEEKENISQLILNENLNDNVELCGFMNKSDIEKIMLGASLYLMTSYTESFGLALLEAQSYGIPVIAFDSAQGANEIIEDEKNGFLIKNRDIEEMSKKSYDILNDINLRKKLGRYGRKCSENYKQENISKKWMEFIRKIS